jgi:fructosamine-3-kinase
MQSFHDLLAGLADGIHRLRTDDGDQWFVKVRRHAPVDFFIAEARGLAALRAARALRVPEVIAVARDAIALEDLGSGRPSGEHWRDAGQRLAQLHAARAATFGFSGGGYCGDSAQDNSTDDDGFHFYGERRLLPQARRARDAGLFDPGSVRCVESLCARLREMLPDLPPVLIHGDLWTGNLHACSGGELALIDAGAVHHGWAECDLAMLTLFGEPPREFFSAYETAAGIDSAWRERAPLLNLYHLLNHLNLFGAGYLAGVRAVLDRFA